MPACSRIHASLSVPDREQFKWPIDVVLLGSRVGRVSHDLRHYTPRHFDPFRQARERATKSVQRDVLETGNRQGAVMWNAWISNASVLRTRTTENPLGLPAFS